MGLLDFGQSKQLPERERVAFAALIAELSRGRRGPGAARPDKVRRCGAVMCRSACKLEAALASVGKAIVQTGISGGIECLVCMSCPAPVSCHLYLSESTEARCCKDSQLGGQDTPLANSKGCCDWWEFWRRCWRA